MEGIDIMYTKWPEDWFEQFWAAYPRRVAKKDAYRALDKVRRNNEAEFGRILDSVSAYAKRCVGKDSQFICHPATWINGGRWDDEDNIRPGDDTSWKVNRAVEETMRRRMQ